MKKLIVKFVIVLILVILGVILFSFTTVSNAQDNPCSKLKSVNENNECLRILVAMRSWREEFPEYYQPIALTHLREANQGDAIDLIVGDKETRFPVLNKDNTPIDVKIRKPSDLLPGSSAKEVLGQMENFIPNADNIFEISWQRGKEEFSTTAITSSRYPFIYDSMLSNVFITRKQKNCVDAQFLWIWGSVRGEVMIDAVAMCKNNEITTCEDYTYYWMTLGKAEAKPDSTSIVENICSFRYAWYATTPFADVEFKSDKFEFKIEGIGSLAGGSKVCRTTCFEN